jgi:hypothetical protein
MLRHSLALSLTWLASAPAAPPGDGWFPFPLSPTAALDGHAMDLTALNEIPAGKSGPISVVGEHFVDGAGRPIRLFGTNLVADGCFPTKEDAPKLAAHLAAVGHNIVRLHFLDHMWGGPSLLKGPNGLAYDLEMLDRLHFFINALRLRGIYINLNLHVGRVYPDSPKDGPQFSKGIDLFHPRYIALFKDYCRFLLGTKNPYTGLTPAQDPCVAVVELNNENTLVMNPWWITKLPDPFATDLRTRWTQWLDAKYTRPALIEKYGIKQQTNAPNLLAALPGPPDAPSYRIERAAPDSATISAAPNGIVWTVKAAGPVPWSHQLSLPVPTITDGQRLTLSFRAHIDRPGRMSASFMQGEAPWEGGGLNTTVDLTTEPQTFRLDFSAHRATGKMMRVSFSALNQLSQFTITDVTLQLVPPGYLESEASLAQGVPFPDAAAPQVVRRDAFAFLAETEIKWARDLKTYLRDDLKVKAPIAHSHVLFGGMLGARRESMVSDFVDTHGYWQHPDFPNKPWDMQDWRIPNTSQIAEAEGGTLTEMAMQRPSGKPYCVSEYDHPMCSDFASEMWPMFATIGSEQAWAGLYSYCFINGAKAWAGQRIHGFFEQSGHPAKHGLISLGALIYRRGLVAPLPAQAQLTVSANALFDDCTAANGDLWGSWRRVWGKVGRTGDLALRARVALAVSEDDRAMQDRLDVPTDAAAPQSQWDAARGCWFLRAPAARVALGRIGDHSHALGDVTATIGPLAKPETGCLALVAADGAASLDEAKTIFIYALQRAENPDMGFNETRTSIGDRWGEGPAHVLGLTATIRLPKRDGWKLDHIDSAGRVTHSRMADQQSIFLSPADATMWYRLTRP